LCIAAIAQNTTRKFDFSDDPNLSQNRLNNDVLPTDFATKKISVVILGVGKVSEAKSNLSLFTAGFIQLQTTKLRR